MMNVRMGLFVQIRDPFTLSRALPRSPLYRHLRRALSRILHGLRIKLFGGNNLRRLGLTKEETRGGGEEGRREGWEEKRRE